MEWDIINKEGTELPQLDDFFPELSVAAFGQIPRVADEKFKTWSMHASKRDEHPLIDSLCNCVPCPESFNKVNETTIELESTRSTLETTWSDLDKT